MQRERRYGGCGVEEGVGVLVVWQDIAIRVLSFGESSDPSSYVSHIDDGQVSLDPRFLFDGGTHTYLDSIMWFW